MESTVQQTNVYEIVVNEGDGSYRARLHGRAIGEADGVTLYETEGGDLLALLEDGDLVALELDELRDWWPGSRTSLADALEALGQDATIDIGLN
jgi:hypothetical protein